MMCGRLLKSEKEEQQGRFYRLTERMFQGMLDWYERGLKWVLDHQPLTLMVAIATLVITIWLYIIIPKGLLPQQDTGLIVGETDAAQSISFKAMSNVSGSSPRLCARIRTSSACFVCGRGHGQRHGQYRASLYQSQAAQPTQGERQRNHRSLARRKPKTSRGSRFSCKRVQDVQIDSRVSRTAVPIHAGGRR